MHKSIGISALALGTALAVAPAAAVSLNLGGDAPVVDLSTQAGDPAASVNPGPGSSVDVDLGGGGDTVSVDVDSGDSDTSVGVDLGGDVGLDLDDGDDNEVSVGLPGGDDVFVDLFGAGAADEIVDADLSDEIAVDVLGGEEDAVVVDLFGGAEDAPVPVARVRLGDTALDDGAGSVDLDGLLGADVIPVLFGEGGSIETVDLGEFPDLGFPGLGFPSSGASQGEDAEADAPANPGVGDDESAVAVAGTSRDGAGSASSTTFVAARATANPARVTATADAKCFTPDDSQIANLVARQSYSDQVVQSWRAAEAVNIVPVRLCPEARVRVSEVTLDDANMARLRGGISAAPALNARLRTTGRSAEDVLAVDNKDGVLTVYIY